MARKKIKKSTKQKASTQSNGSQQLERSFLSTPIQLASLLSKEIAALKQTESKLKANIAKLKMQSEKSTARGKSSAAKKNLAMSTKQLNETTKALNIASNKQAKTAALRKLLSQFEKDWAKKSKTSKVKSTAKKPAAKKSKTLTQSPQPAQDDIFESSVEHIKIGETETIS